MKKSPTTTVLLVAAAIMSLTSLVLCWKFISSARELRSLQTQIAVGNNNRQMINILATEALEYSKKNPAIDPILEWVGAKPARTNTAAPAARPAAR